MKNMILSAFLIVVLAGCGKEEKPLPKFGGEIGYGSLTDARDGQSYKTVKIGNQEWMAENLRFRLPTGSIDGCFTYGEATINPLLVTIDKALFKDSVNAAIAREEIVNPPDLPVMQRPTVIIPLVIDYYTPRQLMDYLIAYPDVVAVLQRINENLAGPAIILQSALNLKKAEDENGGYSKEYGFLYTYSAALNAVPDGWRLPTDEDWKELEKQLGVNENELDNLEDWRGIVADRFLKGKPESVGLDAQLGGGKLYGTFMYGTPFLNRAVSGYYWTGSEHKEKDSVTYVINRIFQGQTKGIWRGTAKKEAAYHVRCIKIK